MLCFALDAGLPLETSAEVKRLCEERFAGSVTIVPAPPSLGVDIGSVAELAGLVVSVIALCLQIASQRHRRRSISGESAAARLSAEVRALSTDCYEILRVSVSGEGEKGSGERMVVLATDARSATAVTLIASRTHDGYQIGIDMEKR